MLKRLASTGINITVLVTAIGVFVVAFFALSAIGEASKPPTIEVIAASRDISIGEPISQGDIITKTVYADDNADLYVPADEVDSVIGGTAALPIRANQPIFRDTILAKAAEGERLAALLADYPGYSLFPLPLDKQNILAPGVESFLPGDLINITFVIGYRPQEQETETPVAPLGTGFTPDVQATPSPDEIAAEEQEKLTYPPLSKDIFPMGVRVVSIQGVPADEVSTDPATGNTTVSQPVSSAAAIDQPKMLILLIPNASREVLALALDQGDLVAVSLLARGDDAPTNGFTYWDLEEWFKADRAKINGGR